MQKVWVLYIQHRHGYDLSAHATSESADAALLQFVKDNWSDRFSEDYPGFEDPGEPMEKYFTPQEDDWGEDLEEYSLEELEIQNLPSVFGG